jgi:hypothetical protein
MQNENILIDMDYLADYQATFKSPLVIKIPEPEAIPPTPKVTIKKSRQIRSEKQIESFNKVLGMMEERRKVKRELKEEATVKAYFERKIKELQTFEEETKTDVEEQS